jgi:hypothetical protein
MLTALLLLIGQQNSHAVAISSTQTPTQAAVKSSNSQVQIPVTLYVMSQCPGEQAGSSPLHSGLVIGRMCHRSLTAAGYGHSLHSAAGEGLTGVS